ncbi:energy transducer TonB [Pelagibaculum spongiae]|uniref:Energy transducer TonB n=1 Tax=Pelagibaculum spongiae TaxID=2080658 RepID=A0A2V1H4L5_9GAMM|nr:TonB family protein [Pelagibaculum spongiae]PVZ72168.1 energy transducer TonB [Pelagibaculum spongiae]
MNKATAGSGSETPDMQLESTKPGKRKDVDRFGFSLVLALVIHLGIFFGIGFSFSSPAKPKIPPALEVTIAQYQSDDEPVVADFIAQANQQGGGVNEESRQAFVEELADTPDEQFKETAPDPVAPSTTQQPQPEKNVITTTGSSDQSIAAVPFQDNDDSPGELQIDQLLALREQIASKQVQLGKQQDQLAKRPTKKFITVATRRAADALYLEDWRTKIERVGNLNFPERAKKQGLQGDLQLEVTLNGNGSVKTVQILQSSGHLILDDAAKRIVTLASPFSAIPQDVLEGNQELVIIRTWKFEIGGLTTSSN